MNINLIAPLNQLGYGIVGTNIALALKKAGAAVSLFPIGQSEVDEINIEDIEEMKANAAEYDLYAPCLRIWHQDQLAEFVGEGEHIGFSFFELDTFNNREKHHISSCNKFFVASKWAQSIVFEHFPKDDGVTTPVIPLGVDRSIFNEGVQVQTLQPDHTSFINIGKWERRKGHDVLIAAFNKAFKPCDKVSLTMVAFNPFIGSMNDEWAKLYLGSPMGRNINLLPRLTDQKRLARVIMSADCGVFPARAEAWNLDLLETMSMGKHVICTNNTGHTEYVSNDNARLVECNTMESAQDGVWFHGQGNWHAIDNQAEEQLIEHMREIHRLKQTGQLGINQSGIDTATRFSWDNAARKIIKVLGESDHE